MFNFKIPINVEDEYILNDFELLRSIYADQIEIINETKINFKINMRMEVEVDNTLIQIIKEFKFDELIEDNHINVPYWIRFDYEEGELEIQIFIFWLKRRLNFFDTFDSYNINQEIIFFSFIENIKSFIIIPEKKLIMNWIQEMKEKSIISNDSIYNLYDQGFNYCNTEEYSEENDIVDDLTLNKLMIRSDKLLEQNLKKTVKIKQDLKKENKTKNSLYHKFIEDGGISGDIISDRGSHFQAHAISIKYNSDIKKYLEYLKDHNKIEKATHNIYAYRFNDMKCKGILSEGFDDDGENDAGIRLLGILQKMKVNNILMVVSRWFGGTNLGNDRFKHINDLAKILLLNNKNKFEMNG